MHGATSSINQYSDQTIQDSQNSNRSNALLVSFPFSIWWGLSRWEYSGVTLVTRHCWKRRGVQLNWWDILIRTLESEVQERRIIGHVLPCIHTSSCCSESVLSPSLQQGGGKETVISCVKSLHHANRILGVLLSGYVRGNCELIFILGGKLSVTLTIAASHSVQACFWSKIGI